MPQSQDYTAEHARAAAEIQADVGVERVADVYAQALLGAAEKAGQTEAVVEEFDALVGGVLDRHPRLAAILASALISHEEKAGILDRLFAARLSPLLLNYLKVVSRHGRLDCLRAIHRRLHALYDQMRGLVHVRLSTAAPIDDALADRITASLRSVLGRQPVLHRSTEPDLIGGAVFRIGDTVYDDSIANHLQLIRQQMIDRSAHEIQSRRDRFRNSAGN